MSKRRPEAILDVYKLLLGALLFVSPWLFAFAGSAAATDARADGSPCGPRLVELLGARAQHVFAPNANAVGALVTLPDGADPRALGLEPFVPGFARLHASTEGLVAYAAAVLDHPLPWTKMRQTYALLGLVKRWGPDRVEAACARALEAETISVPL